MIAVYITSYDLQTETALPFLLEHLKIVAFFALLHYFFLQTMYIFVCKTILKICFNKCIIFKIFSNLRVN